MQRHSSLTSLSSLHSARADSVRDTSTESLFSDARFTRKPRKVDPGPGAKPFSFPNGEVFTPRSAPRQRARPPKTPEAGNIPRARSMVSVPSAGLRPHSAAARGAPISPRGSLTPAPSSAPSPLAGQASSPGSTFSSGPAYSPGPASSPASVASPGIYLSGPSSAPSPKTPGARTSGPAYLTRFVSFNNLKARSKQDLMASIRTTKIDTPTNISIPQPPPAKAPLSHRAVSLTNNRYAQNSTNIVRSESLLGPETQSPVARATGSDSNPSSISMYMYNRSGSNTPQTSLSGSDGAEHVPLRGSSSESVSSAQNDKEITSLASIKETSSPVTHASPGQDAISLTTSSPKSKLSVASSAQPNRRRSASPEEADKIPFAVEKPVLELVSSSQDEETEPHVSESGATMREDERSDLDTSDTNSTGGASSRVFEMENTEPPQDSKRHSYAESTERTISSDVGSQSTITHQATLSSKESANPEKQQRSQPLSPRLSLSGSGQGWFGLLKRSKSSSRQSLATKSMDNVTEDDADNSDSLTSEQVSQKNVSEPAEQPRKQVVKSLISPEPDVKSISQTSFSERKNAGLFLSLEKSAQESSTPTPDLTSVGNIPEDPESEPTVSSESSKVFHPGHSTESVSVDVEQSEIYSPVHIKQFLNDDQKEVPARKDLHIMDGKVKLHKRKPSTECSSPLVAVDPNLSKTSLETHPKFARNSMLAVVDVDYDKGLPPTPSGKRFAKGPLDEAYSDSVNGSQAPKSPLTKGASHKKSTPSISGESKLRGFRKYLGLRPSSRESQETVRASTPPTTSGKTVETKEGPTHTVKKKKSSFFSKFSKAEDPKSPVYSVREKSPGASYNQTTPEPQEQKLDLPTFESDDHIFDDVLLKFDQVKEDAEKEALSQKKTKSIHDFFSKDDELTKAQIFDQQKKDTVNSSESLLSRIQNDSSATLHSSDEDTTSPEDELPADLAHLFLPEDGEVHTINLSREQLSQAWEVHDRRSYLKYVRQFADFETVRIELSGFDPTEKREIEASCQSTPILRKEDSEAVGTRKVQFSNHISISDTFAPHMYKRNNKAVTQYFVTEKAEINRIKNELNAYKCHEMLVHEKSQMNTHFYY